MHLILYHVSTHEYIYVCTYICMYVCGALLVVVSVAVILSGTAFPKIEAGIFA